MGKQDAMRGTGKVPEKVRGRAGGRVAKALAVLAARAGAGRRRGGV